MTADLILACIVVIVSTALVAGMILGDIITNHHRMSTFKFTLGTILVALFLLLGSFSITFMFHT